MAGHLLSQKTDDTAAVTSGGIAAQNSVLRGRVADLESQLAQYADNVDKLDRIAELERLDAETMEVFDSFVGLVSMYLDETADLKLANGDSPTELEVVLAQSIFQLVDEDPYVLGARLRADIVQAATGELSDEAAQALAAEREDQAEGPVAAA